ncbi:MAG: DUF1854 domain-containing protein [Clostridia bacterium]|nr:DUF1854 domain-containing protein [Clostridia bacterium]
MGRIYIDKYTGKLERSDLYLVRLTLKDGTVYDKLEPRKLFPFSNQTMYITLLDKDEKEIGFVRDFAELDEASQCALEECFEEYYMIPKITRMISCEEKFGALKWTVMTDRGEVSFRIRSRHSDIKHLHGTNRILIRDSNDNRYEITDYTAMDAHSAHLLFAYL